ncbi:MAG: O-antigen ligase family protein [Pseudomonadota bacterium]
MIMDREDPSSAGARLLRLADRLTNRTVAFAFFFTVTVAALPMGGNREWVWAPLAMAVGGLSVAVAILPGFRSGFSVRPPERRPLVAVTACFLVLVAFGFLQMSPFAPASGSAWYYETAARLLGAAHAPVPALAIDAARSTLIKIVTCGAVFALARAICRDVTQARLLLMMIVLSAMLAVVYGIIMQAAANSCYLGSYLKKVGDYRPGDSCVMSGPFVNSNSFGCYCGMGIVAALALALADRRREGGKAYGYGAYDEEGLLASLTALRLALMAACLFLMGGLLWSASRAAFAATGAGIAGVFVLLLRQRPGLRSDVARWGVGAAVVVAAAVMLIAGGRLLTKASGGADGEGRGAIWAASLEAISASPWFGWGLGGFPDIYAVMQPSSLPIPNDLAHSTPLQMMVEVGVPMALVAFAIVLIPWGMSLQGAFRRRSGRRYLPVAAFAVAAVPILHSMIDFSLQMPAIGFVVSAVLGMGWAQSFDRRERQRTAFTRGQ